MEQTSRGAGLVNFGRVIMKISAFASAWRAAIAATAGTEQR